MSAARILRTRSGRELRRIETVPRKNKSKSRENETLYEENKPQTNIQKIDVIGSTSRRKRGRPKKKEEHFENEIDCKAQASFDDISESPKSEIPPRKHRKVNHNEDVDADNENTDQPRRKPRMASLNALAKVNAVLECYRSTTDIKREIQEQINEIDKKCSEKQENSVYPSKPLQDIPELDENVFVETPSEFNAKSIEATVGEISSEKALDDYSSEVEIFMLDKDVQTDTFNKSNQTEFTQFPDDSKYRICTCPKSCEDAFLYYSPAVKYGHLANPIHVKSTALTHTKTHTLALPVMKTHVLWDKESSTLNPSNVTENVTCLIDSCLTNTLLKNSFACSKLMYLSSMKQPDATPKNEIDWKIDGKESEQKSKPAKGLLVPCLNYANISVPNSQYHNEKKTTSSTKKSKVKSSHKKQKCNGWEFEGTAVEEQIKQNGVMITRKYYQGLRRNGEEIKLQDAVMLNSGLEKYGGDYIARISTLWEDIQGVHTGEMMMSVFWYYKPEQMVGKQMGEVRGEKMEVFASRHKDDNSVACIVDRCFVVSFPQFCRFRAQHLIHQEERKRATSLVPESKNSRSRFIPSPDTNPSLVYFCRYGYDYRCGKLLKSI